MSIGKCEYYIYFNLDIYYQLNITRSRQAPFLEDTFYPPKLEDIFLRPLVDFFQMKGN